MPLADGQCFAGYTILRHLGSGGMGEIYLAQHPRLPRSDALKVLPTICADDHEYRERFKREAAIAATLWHPSVVGVHDLAEAGHVLHRDHDLELERLPAARVLLTYNPRSFAGR